ncbi:hypothetical protein AAD001_03350 [Colwelliaceae bacterium 6471]
MKIIKTLLPIFILATSASYTQAANSDWIFCTVTDDYHSAVYFTKVFHGEYDLLEQYENDFFQHVKTKYGGDMDESISCSFEAKKAATIDEFSEQLADSEEFYDKVITTAWAR